MMTLHIENTNGNDGGLSNYRYAVLVNDNVIHIGDVVGHDRRDGWRELLRMIANNTQIDVKHQYIKTDVK